MSLILRLLFLMILAALSTLPVPTAAQEDGLNLPTGLYVLLNSGIVQRYGRGAAGIATVTPEDAFVIDFGVSPDGNWIAYRTETALTVTGLYEDTVSDIERGTAGLPPFRGMGDTIAWSPSGDAVAYITEAGLRVYYRQTGTTAPADDADAVTSQNPETDLQQLIWSPDGRYLAAGAAQNIWWVYRRDGAVMTLVSAIPSSIGTAWYRGGGLIFAPEAGGLYLLDLDNANAQTELLAPDARYRLPYVRQDGIVALLRAEADSEEFLLAEAIITNDSAQTTITGTGAVALEGVRWAPEGRLLVAQISGGLTLINPQTGSGFTLPIADVVAYGWEGVQTFTATPNIAQDVYFLAQDLTAAAQVWRLTQGSPAFPLTQSASGVTAFAVRGEQLVYASDEQIQISSSLTPTEPTARLALGDRQVTQIALSTDGSQIAYTLRDSGVWLVSAAGEDDPRLLLENGAEGAPPFHRLVQFAPNLNALLAIEGGSETTAFVLVDLTTFDVRPLGSYDHAFFLRDGRVLAYGSGVGIGEPPTTIEVVTFDVNTPAQIQPLVSLPGSIAVRAVAEGAPNTLLIATAPNRLPHGPYLMNVAELSLGNVGSNFAELTSLTAGFAYTPTFNAEGSLLLGYANLRFIGEAQAGSLIISDLAQGSSVTLSEPANVWAAQWGA